MSDIKLLGNQIQEVFLNLVILKTNIDIYNNYIVIFPSKNRK
jgi:hypothetical protein